MATALIYYAPAPPPPISSVTLDLSEQEARALRALLGSISASELAVIRAKATEEQRPHLPESAYALGHPLNAVYSALKEELG